jgi:cytoskeletal protein CcmA (bactofilin family)
VGQIDNLAEGNLGDVFRRLRALEFASNQNNMAVGRGGIRVHGGGGITIENGGLVVSGSATISGELIADGTITMSGTFTATGDVNLNGPTAIAGDTTVTGDFTVTGPTALNGTTTVAGDTTVTGVFTVNGAMKTTSTLSVEGVTTLKNDLNVTTGKIVAGDVSIDPAYLSGSLRFANGTYLAATPNGAQLVKSGGGGAVTVSSSQADMSAGSLAFILNSVGAYLTGLPTTSNPSNLYIDPANGRLYRVI